MTEQAIELPSDEEAVNDAQRIADMTAEYNVLLSKLLSTCNDTAPQVAIAALASAIGCIAVQAIPNMDSATGYIQTCVRDVLLRMPEAYQHRNQVLEKVRGTDTGEASQDVH